MAKPNICVLSEIPRLFSLIKQNCSHLAASIVSVNPKEAKGTEQELVDAQILVTEPHFAPLWLYGLPNLKMVHGTWAGIDSMMKYVKPDNTPSITYCRYGGKFGQSMAEYVLAYIVAQERNFKMTYEQENNSHWSHAVTEYIWFNSRSLDTLSIGILGLGDIGRTVARLCKAAGMEIWGLVNTIPSNRCEFVDEYRTSDDIGDVLSNCDYICSILPSTPKTRGLLDNDRFKACSSRKSVFINVGRGDLCSEQSILQALDKGWLRAAILDVVPTEPLPKDSLLWKHPNITITPHVGAVSLPEQLIELIAENIENFVNGRSLKYQIDWNKGY